MWRGGKGTGRKVEGNRLFPPHMLLEFVLWVFFFRILTVRCLFDISEFLCLFVAPDIAMNKMRAYIHTYG